MGIKKILKKSTPDKKKISFKNIGYKIIRGRKSLNPFKDSTKYIAQELEKTLMIEYLEMDENVYNSRINRLFSKHVKIFFLISSIYFRIKNLVKIFIKS